MKTLNEFDIPFIGLKLGIHRFNFSIEDSFFESIVGCTDYFNTAQIEICVKLEKSNHSLTLGFDAEGSVNVNCDLSSEPYDQPIKGHHRIHVKFGEHFCDDDDEILILPQGTYKLNVSQYIYDLILLSIPKRLIHPDVANGTMKSEILSRFERLQEKTSNTNKDSAPLDPRWETLKELLTDHH